MGDMAWIIGFAPFAIGGLAIWTKHQSKMAELQSNAAAEKAAQYAVDHAKLEERVRVLERIVTDKGYDVSLQIEALRDSKQAERRDQPEG
ncbi:MAG: hypothetical protein R3D89_01185 [Sphingomonadaceae bacterium]|jgi:predicted ArsR family transcriptional regulator